MEDFTNFNVVMDRMLSNVDDQYDKREGSVIWDAIAPCARELVNMATVVKQAQDNTFAGTAEREWLIKCCAEIGLKPFDATYAIRKAEFTPTTLEIKIGERFTLENVIFKVTEKIEDGQYYLQCEELGEIGNNGSGYILPVNYIEGLETAIMLAEVVKYGEEEEDTEALRQRYFDTLPTMTLDGNIAQYEKWCREYEGIGNYDIIPEWRGKNTVKVSILSSENTLASKELIDAFQEYLDPKKNEEDDHGEGLGMGKAPIGAIVTVSTAIEIPINVKAVLILKEGFEEPTDLDNEIAEYLKTLNYNKSLVSYVAISAVIQNNRAVDSVLDVTINDTKDNITLEREQIAKLGETTWEVQ